MAASDGLSVEARHYAETIRTDDTVPRLAARLATHDSPVIHGRESAGLFREEIVRRVRQGDPISLIRLGDGEGNVLFWSQHREDRQQLAEFAMNRIWRLMFGRHKAPKAVWDAMASGMAEAVLGATHLGIPVEQQVTERLQALEVETGREVAGSVGVVAVWDWLASARPALPSPRQTVLRWHLHVDLLDFYPDVVQAAGNVSTVSCYPELLGRLANHCGVGGLEAIPIPPQAVNISGTPSEVHYPDVTDQIIEHFARQNLTGRLFLVGAGIAGKTYCEAIRKAGGMAIDVGSLMDVWMGKSVRPYQSSQFVDRHRLPE